MNKVISISSLSVLLLVKQTIWGRNPLAICCKWALVPTVMTTLKSFVRVESRKARMPSILYSGLGISLLSPEELSSEMSTVRHATGSDFRKWLVQCPYRIWYARITINLHQYLCPFIISLNAILPFCLLQIDFRPIPDSIRHACATIVTPSILNAMTWDSKRNATPILPWYITMGLRYCWYGVYA